MLEAGVDQGVATAVHLTLHLSHVLSNEKIILNSGLIRLPALDLCTADITQCQGRKATVLPK